MPDAPLGPGREEGEAALAQEGASDKNVDDPNDAKGGRGRSEVGKPSDGTDGNSAKSASNECKKLVNIALSFSFSNVLDAA